MICIYVYIYLLGVIFNVQHCEWNCPSMLVGKIASVRAI